MDRLHSNNMPPYSLPKDAAVSGIKSATHQGFGYNEISMNDTDQSQLMRLHAQHDMDTTVLNNKRERVGVNRTRKVGVDESITVGNDRTKEISNNESITIGNSRCTQINVNDNTRVAANQDTKIGANSSLSIDGDKSETVQGRSKESVGGSKIVSVSEACQVTVGAVMYTTVAVSSTEQVGLIKHVFAGGKIILSCGAASISLDCGGAVSIKGTALDFTADGPVKINGSVIDLN